MTQRIAGGFVGLSGGAVVFQGLTEVEFIKDLLSTQAIDEGSQQEIQGIEARILRKHLRKTVIDYIVRFRNSTEKNYIGLHREDDERLGVTFSVLKTLRSNGFGEGSALSVPQPVLYMPSLSFLMMEKAKGESLREILERKGDPTSHIKAAAQWLAKLHSSDVTLERECSQDDEVAASLKFARAAAWLFPRFNSRIQSISEQLVRAQKALTPSRKRSKRLVHGDYHPRNIIVSQQLTTVIDFEEARMGDPAFDVGYFMAQVKMTHGTGPIIVRATETFFREYQESQPSTETDFGQRVATFEAQTYFQRIYHAYYLLELEPNFDLISEWLNESGKNLQKAWSLAHE